MTRLHVHIDRLTLEGGTRADGRRVVEAIERQLGVLANQGPMPETAGRRSVGRMDAGTVAHKASPDAIGNRIATQVFRKLGGPRNA